MKTKYLELVRVLERRVQAGDYALEQMPSERKLAAELGVSHMTARRAVQHLIESGLIKRHSTHSRSAGSKGVLKIACVMPAFESVSLGSFFRSLTGVVASKGGIVRPVSYTSWHDPMILEVLDGDFDGVFILPPTDLPQVMLDRLVRVKDRLVTFFYDLTHLGIPCVDNGRADSVMQLVGHLVELGHRRISMFNTQPHDTATIHRIAAWKAGLDQYGVSGDLYDEPVAPMEAPDDRAMELAERLVEQKIIAAGSKTTAMIASTLETSRAVMRVLANHGLRVPRDLSLAACDQVRAAQQMVPSVTTINTPRHDEFVQQGLEWILSRGINWNRPLMICPESVSVWAGESTAKPITLSI